MDREAAARAIAENAKRARPPTPRWLWLLALVVGVACVAGLAIGWIEDRHTATLHPLARRAAEHESGFWLGLLVGLGIGVAITSVALARKRR